jgi:hypothetical protein
MSDESTTVTPDVQPGSVVEAPVGLERENSGTMKAATYKIDIGSSFDLDTRKPTILFDLADQKDIRCVNPVPTGELLQALRRAIKAGQKDITTVDAVDLLEGWVDPEDRDRFNLAIDHLIDWEDINRSINKIMEAAAARPTEAS